MVFPVVTYGYESWTIKKTEHRRIDAFELWCWRRLLGIPWTARRSNQSILKEITPGCSLEGLMLKLKLQYFGPLMQRVDSLEKTLMLGAYEFEHHKLTWSTCRHCQYLQASFASEEDFHASGSHLENALHSGLLLFLLYGFGYLSLSPSMLGPLSFFSRLLPLSAQCCQQHRRLLPLLL